MQTTSATWRTLWAAGAALEVKAVINGTTYTDISAPTIDRALMQAGLSIGNVVSATCRFSIRDPGVVPRSAEVAMSMRLNDGTTQSEWLPVGTFYVSRRQRDPVTGILALECYDAMLKANAPYVTSGSYPKRMGDAVNEIAMAIGVNVDARTHIIDTDAYTIPLPDADTAMNTILSGIASACGGNFIITPANELRFVPFTASSGAASAQTDVVDVDGIVGSINASAAQTVTGLRVVTDNGDAMSGNENGIIIAVDTPYINDTNLDGLTNSILGQLYQPYTLTGAIYDPAVELGDYVRAGANGEVSSVLCGESATLGAAFRGNITALEPAEIGDEYPYINQVQKNTVSIRRLNRVIADEVEAINGRFDSLSVEDIRAGIIHSADYAVEVIAKIYPQSDQYPGANVYPNNGERVISGFAIDFSTGQIYGALYSEQIAALQNALVYPKAP